MDRGKKKLAVADLKSGSKCGSDIQDEQGRILLSAGTVLSPQFMDRLAQRGIEEVFVQESPPTSNDQPQARGKSSSGPLKRIDRSRETYSPQRADRFRDTFESIGSTLGGMIENGAFSEEDAEQLGEFPSQVADILCEDSDQAILALQDQNKNIGLCKRCTQFSTLAMAIGMELQYSKRELELLGMSGLLHDLSLFLEPPELSNPTLTLSAEQAERYRAHPLKSADLLSGSMVASEEIRVLVTQVHELPDGSGFPRRLKGHRLHKLSKVLSVAETYLALTVAGPGRPAIVPHDAMAYMLFKCKEGLFDSDVMRAFLRQMTLFPIGCSVSLSDGRDAVVARRDNDNYAAPVVRVKENDEWIVTHDSEVSIERPIMAVDRKEMRLNRDLMSELPLRETLGELVV